VTNAFIALIRQRATVEFDARRTHHR